MIRKALFIALAILMTAAPARAEKTGELYTACTSKDPAQEEFCLGFLAGSVHWLSCEGNPTYGALEQAFKNWAAKHPETWGFPAWLGVSLAISPVWHCGQ